MLEEKFIKTQQYVELTPENYDTFSNEYASLLITIGAEVDALFKLNCSIDPREQRSTIADYVSLAPEVVSIEVEIMDRELDTIVPFEKWDIEKPAQSLEWWQAYTSIKHDRESNRHLASQKNVLYALAALCLLENTMLKKIADEYKCKDVPFEYSKQFYIVGWEYNSSVYSKYEKDIYLHLDENNEADRSLVEMMKNFGMEGGLYEPAEE